MPNGGAGERLARSSIDAIDPIDAIDFMRASASDLGIYGSEPVCGPESRVGLGAALIDPDEAGGERPGSSKRIALYPLPPDQSDR